LKREETIQTIAEATGLPKVHVAAVLKQLASLIESQVARGDVASVPGVGDIATNLVAPRLLRAVKDQRRQLLGWRYRINFRPTARVRRAAAARAPDLLLDPAHQEAWRYADTLVADLAEYGAWSQVKLQAASSDSEVRSRLAGLAGESWDAVVRSYEGHVPADLRRACDHLALAARVRFR
jgi:nucleoid DNA-binding protein